MRRKCSMRNHKGHIVNELDQICMFFGFVTRMVLVHIHIGSQHAYVTYFNVNSIHFGQSTMSRIALKASPMSIIEMANRWVAF